MNYFLLFLLFIACDVRSQQVEGVVLNGKDSSGLVGASVFINNSSKGTITTANGRFSITGLAENNFELVISYVGFNTESIHINSVNLKSFYTIKLFPRVQPLDEVSVIATDKNGWEKWGGLFTDLFLGISDFALACTIENPEILRFYKIKKTSVVHAYSNAPLIIKNKALGYIIKYQLEDFVYNPNTGISGYAGYSTFEDMAVQNNSKSKKWHKNREEAYKGSILHFMRSLYSNKVSVNGFDVHEKIRVYAKDSAFNLIYKYPIPSLVRVGDKIYKIKSPNNDTHYFEIKDTLRLVDYIDLIDTAAFSFKKASTMDLSKKQRSFYFRDYLEVSYKNAFEKSDYLRYNLLPLNSKLPQSSDIYLSVEELLLIEEDGMYFNPVNPLVSGYFAWPKIAGTLPSDYVDEE